MIELCLVRSSTYNSKQVTSKLSTKHRHKHYQEWVEKKIKDQCQRQQNYWKKNEILFVYDNLKGKKYSILIQSLHKKFDAVNNARIHNAQTEFLYKIHCCWLNPSTGCHQQMKMYLQSTQNKQSTKNLVCVVAKIFKYKCSNL